MKSSTIFLVATLLSACFTSIHAQTFDWKQDGYSNHSSGGFYTNIDGSGVDLKISGLVNDEAVGGNIKTGKNDQEAQGQTHSYTFTFSENVDIEFTISDINLDTTKECFDDAVILSGMPFIIESQRVRIHDDTLIQPNQKENDFDAGQITVQYHDVSAFTIRHGTGTSCNPGYIVFSPIKFQQSQKVLQFGADTLHYQDIQFDSRQKSLKDEYHASLDSLIQLLKGDENMKVILLGFADDHKRSEDNSPLSRKRVNAVLAYLLLKGIDRSKLIAKYYGEEKAENSNVNTYGHGQNKRVEIYTTP